MMNPKTLIYIIGVLILYSCHGKQMRSELQRIDSLNQTGAKLDTVTSLQNMVMWFDKWGTSNEKMSAHYLMGRSAYDKGDMPKALVCFRQAMEYADTMSAECDFKRLSRVYGQIAEVYHQQRVPQMELDAEKKAVDYAWRAKDSLSAWMFYSYLAPVFNMLNQPDSALYYSRRASAMLRAMGHESIAAAMEIDVAAFELQRRNYPEVIRILNEYEKHSGFFDQKGNVERGKELYYVYRGKYYQYTGHSDSAVLYYRKALRPWASFSAKVNAYKGLMDYFQQQKQEDSIVKYAKLYCQTNDTANLIHSGDEIVRATAIYNYEDSQHKAMKATKKTKHYRFVTGIVVVAFVCLTGLLCVFVRRRRRIVQQHRNTIRERYMQLTTEYNKVVEELNQSRLGWEEFQKNKKQELEKLRQELVRYVDSEMKQTEWNDEMALLHSPIVCQFHKNASRAFVPSQMEWIELEKVIKQDLPQFTEVLYDKRHMMSEKEQMTCVLTRLHFTPAEMSVLMGVTKQRVANLRSDANRKLFGEKSAKTLKKNIMRLG